MAWLKLARFKYQTEYISTKKLWSFYVKFQKNEDTQETK